ncbi:NUDIX hydrolase [Peribacillus acanthi]|uniref:NUDIX hydrolase n=1 Tax=Peribacillus acanthi TaxID=2171554 RepID=UPI000D3E9993|nr:NUDIX domain-containing protein [Peribacillus acanthi]
MFVVNVEGAILKDGKWLIIERGSELGHAAGTLSLVGGQVEDEGNKYDIIENTLKREILEEVGIEVKDNLKYVHSSSFLADDGCKVIDIVLLCEHKNGVPFRNSPKEVANIYWMSTEEVINHSKAPTWTKESIKRADLLLHKY